MSETPTSACRPPNTAASPSSAAAVARRIPGKAKAHAEALHDYEALNARRRAQIPSALWPFWAPAPDELYRWRVQLTCGCIREVLTHGDKDLPAEGRYPDPVHNSYLPLGQMWCRHEDATHEQYQDIIEWGARREHTFPADPLEPLHDIDAETWKKIRHDEPRSSAFWTVTLACGHATEVVSELQWQPSDGPTTVSAKRQRDMTDEFEQLWAMDPDNDSDRDREHTRRQLAAGWPRPAPERLCYTCPHVRTIVTYQGVDWLLPRKKSHKEKAESRPSRKKIEERLAKAQAEMKALQDQLAAFDQQGLSTE
ncbi:hypothetical protein [Rhodococcus sp. NPDC057529]|uniref:hypothetical protein n=1 Tax=Rhodococcus sp. NPDC057529 TaxID=3346158 RepID=UPI00366CA6B8